MEAWRDELYHHGIIGQRWGVRRFQNDDGSLTAAGRERYGVGDGDDDDYSQQYQDIRPDDSYNAELSRISPNAQYESMMNDTEMQRQIEEQKRRTRNIVIGVGAAIAVTAGGIVIAKKFREAKEERNALADALKELGDKSVSKDDLKDYAKSDALKDLAKKSDLNGFVKTDAIKDMAKKSDLNGFVKSDAIKDVAKKSDLSGLMKTADANKTFAKIGVTKDFVKKGSLNSYVKKTDLKNATKAAAKKTAKTAAKKTASSWTKDLKTKLTPADKRKIRKNMKNNKVLNGIFKATINTKFAIERMFK